MVWLLQVLLEPVFLVYMIHDRELILILHEYYSSNSTPPDVEDWFYHDFMIFG